jgi:multidrug efflux system membrane fusion protein
MKKFYLLLFAAAIVSSVIVWFARDHTELNAQAAAPAPAVPVTATPAKLQDVPVYLRGLGTVLAFNTVEIKAQVNGMLIAIPVHEGQEVRQGDIVAQIDPRPYQAALDQATAQRAEDAAQLQSAQLDLQRYQHLAKSQFAPVQQVDDQQATVNKLVATMQADTAAIETAQINLDYCTIRAPINGRVSFHQTDIGNLIEVANQTGIVSITQDTPISVVFTLPEAELPRIHQAMATAVLPVAAYDGDDKTKLADGQLLTPNNAIDTTTGTIQLKATFLNDNDALWPGEFVNARLRVDTLRRAVTVPVAAIQHGPSGLFLYTVKPDNTVQEHAVRIAYQDDDTAVTAEGVKGGEDVVLTGQSRLAPGTRVAMSAGSPAPGARRQELGRSFQ